MSNDAERRTAELVEAGLALASEFDIEAVLRASQKSRGTSLGRDTRRSGSSVTTDF